MIPPEIKKEYIIKAIKIIDSEGISPQRKSRKFFLIFKGKQYPPKYVLSLAYKFVDGKELDIAKFSGGRETNNFLKKLGFDIVEMELPKKNNKLKASKKKDALQTQQKHSENCSECKNAIQKMLEKIYGDVKREYKFKLNTKIENFKDFKFYQNLKEIFIKLQKHRGYEDFIKRTTLSTCDYFIPNPGFIVEYDESQHFTTPRKISLQNYPRDLKIGFSLEKWINLCDKLNRKDNDPPSRDEQRAWYDTLRDFLPEFKGLYPTVRLYSKEKQWCSLNPENLEDIEEFKRVLKRKSSTWKIDIKEESNPFFARIIIAEKWNGSKDDVNNLIEKICEIWPRGQKVKFIITCGGFIQFPLPKSILSQNIKEIENNYTNLIKDIVSKAEKVVKIVLTEDLIKKLRDLADYITIGIDSFEKKYHPYLELVSLIDLRNKKYYWTGKSYPTSKQHKTLIQIKDLRSHFVELDDVGKIMILGCHDLNLFNNRNWKNTGEWRRNIKNKFKKLAKNKAPYCVLHHPHSTVKIRSWSNPLHNLRKMLPSVKKYVSAGKYFEPNSDQTKWNDIEKILQYTKSGNSLDFIIRSDLK